MTSVSVTPQTLNLGYSDLGNAPGILVSRSSCLTCRALYERSTVMRVSVTIMLGMETAGWFGGAKGAKGRVLGGWRGL